MAKVKNSPTVSVVIPTYNRAHLTGRAIRSVLNQTYHDFEIIVVDDGSTDNTEEVIKKIQEQDKRIRYIQHEKNKGAAAARNTGIKAAQGEYIAFQDSDDEWLPEKLEKQMKAFATAPAGVGVVYTGHWRIEDNKKIYMPSSMVTQKEGNIHKELLKEGFGFVITPSAVIRKKCFEKSGMFDENLPRLQEWELFIRVSKYYKFKCIDEPLVNSYCKSDSISTSHEALIKALEIILTRHYEDFKENGKSLSKRYYSIGIFLCSNNKIKQGRSYLIKAVKIYPFNIKFLLVIVVFLSFFGQDIYNKVAEKYRKIRKWITW